MAQLYMIYDLKDGDLYAWTEFKELAKMFMATRKRDRFHLKKKKLEFETEVDKFIYDKFKSDNRDKLICMTYLGQEGQDTDYIEFPVTRYEDFEIGDYCDNLYDDMINLSRRLCLIPFTDKIRDVLEFLAIYASKNEHISFDTFKIFMKLFGDTVL